MSENMVKVDKMILNIENIANSGQCFRLRKVGEGKFTLIANGRLTEIFVDKNAVLLSCDPSYFEGLLKDYFDLSTDYTLIKNIADKDDTYLQNAIQMFGDITILRQDLWEVIVSFIVSQRKSIPAIQSCIEKLCSYFGNGYEFPDAETIVNLSAEDIEKCGVGYRSKYILAAAKWYLDTPRETITKYSVRNIYGVGDKVANCIGLFGLHDLSCCPIDVWMQRIIERRYHNTIPAWMHSEYAGVYQQYVFMYERYLNRREKHASIKGRI